MSRLLAQCEHRPWNTPGVIDFDAAAAAAKAEKETSGNVSATPAVPVAHPGFNLEQTRIAFEKISNAHQAHLEQAYPDVARRLGESGAASLAGQDAPLSKQAREYGQKWLSDLEPQNVRLRAWLNENDIDVIPNSGRGNNCLIISLLQHATGNYADVHREKAEEIRRQIGHSNMLHCDNAEEFAVVLALINAEYSVNMRPYFVQASALWTPYMLPEVDIGDDPVMIWHEGNHYEALIAKA